MKDLWRAVADLAGPLRVLTGVGELRYSVGGDRAYLETFALPPPIATVPGERYTIVLSPRGSAFQPRRLIISSACARHFRVRRLTGAGAPIVQPLAPVPAEVFMPDQMDATLMPVTVGVGEDLVLEIETTENAPPGVLFVASIVGRELREWIAPARSFALLLDKDLIVLESASDECGFARVRRYSPGDRLDVWRAWWRVLRRFPPVLVTLRVFDCVLWGLDEATGAIVLEAGQTAAPTREQLKGSSRDPRIVAATRLEAIVPELLTTLAGGSPSGEWLAGMMRPRFVARYEPTGFIPDWWGAHELAEARRVESEREAKRKAKRAAAKRRSRASRKAAVAAERAEAERRADVRCSALDGLPF